MAIEKAKGSIVYELLIVILAVVLVASVLYPQRLREHEERNIEISRKRMTDIFHAEIQYHSFNGNVYNDTLSKVIDFLKNDPRYAAYVDSLVFDRLDSLLRGLARLKADQNVLASRIPSATDSAMTDSLARLQMVLKARSRLLADFTDRTMEGMKNIPNSPEAEFKEAFLVLNSKQFTMPMEIAKNFIEKAMHKEAQNAIVDLNVVMDFVIKQFEVTRERASACRDNSLDSLYYCPTTRKPYILVNVDTSVIKRINIYSPIDTLDMFAVENDFVRSSLGGLKIENHGKIESGEKSWDSGQ